MAQTASLADIPWDVMLYRLAPVVLAVLAPLLGCLALRVSRVPLAGPLAVAVAFGVAAVTPAPAAAAGPITPLHAAASPSQQFGVAVLGLLLLVLVVRWRHPVTPGTTVLLLGVLLVASATKGAILPVVLAGLLLASAVSLVARLPRRRVVLTDTALTGVVLAGSIVLVFGGPPTAATCSGGRPPRRRGARRARRPARRTRRPRGAPARSCHRCPRRRADGRERAGRGVRRDRGPHPGPPGGHQRRAPVPASLSVGEREALRLLRDTSEPDDVVMSNKHCRSHPRPGCDHRQFLVAAYAEPRVLVEGWVYSRRAGLAYRTQDGNRSYAAVDFWDPALLRLNDGFYADPSAAAARRLWDRGVRWVVVWDHAQPVRDSLAVYTTPLTRTPRLAVLALDRPD